MDSVKENSPAGLETDWDAEYKFWHKIISEEVERLRFNEGYEPIEVDLYATDLRRGPDFVGETQIGHVRFEVRAHWWTDSKKTLRVKILKAP
jgi:hypothetical protein